MTTLYNLSIYFYYIIIYAASFFNKKAKLWLDGRKNIFERLTLTLSKREGNSENKSEIRNPKSEIIWFHCASLGEFEQGRPLIEKFRIQNLEFRILVTFFSPSGYEIRKNYSGADFIFYLPLDTPANAKKFIKIVRPALAIFIKYEFWYNYLNELHKKNIPTYLVSAIFREEQHFFKWYNSFGKNTLKNFSHIFVQNQKSFQLLENIGIKNVTISGDTRFDRVSEIVRNKKSIPLIEKFKDGKQLIVAGSTWEADEQLISDFGFSISDLKLIIAPHEISESRINSITHQLNNSIIIKFSEANEENIKSATILIIDNIGMLSSLYQYADIAYIGGGFGSGIHNILEATAYGIPVLFGPKYQKFNEAVELIERGGAFSINNSEELKSKINLFLSDKFVIKIASEIAKNFVSGNEGATKKIINFITKNRH